MTCRAGVCTRPATGPDGLCDAHRGRRLLTPVTAPTPDLPSVPRPFPVVLDGWVATPVWFALLTLAHMRIPEVRWTVVGGTMVNFHLAQHGRDPRRATKDADVIVDVRYNPGALPQIADRLVSQGYAPKVGMDASGATVAHQFIREDDATIDLLAPDGRAERLQGARHHQRWEDDRSARRTAGATPHRARAVLHAGRRCSTAAPVPCWRHRHQMLRNRGVRPSSGPARRRGSF